MKVLLITVASLSLFMTGCSSEEAIAEPLATPTANTLPPACVKFFKQGEKAAKEFPSLKEKQEKLVTNVNRDLDTMTADELANLKETCEQGSKMFDEIK